jgi:hypothetical protein
MDINILKITWKMVLGSEGEDSDPANPFSRSLNRLLDDGQPFKRLTKCFWAQMPLAERLQKLWWFGVFILSEGNRVIYFPGLKETKQHVQGYRGNDLKWDKEFDVDHISLEKDYLSWHITSRKSKDHLGSPTPHTADLGEGRRLWFGMSIADFSVLWPLSRETTVIAKSPSSDVKRRAKILMDAREGAQFQIIEPHPEADKIFPNGFFHVSVILGPSNFKQYEGQNHGFPVGSPFLTSPLPESVSNSPVRYHRVLLSNNLEMQITTAKLPGSLRVPVTFTVGI